jgi:hypothetical protein
MTQGIVVPLRGCRSRIVVRSRRDCGERARRARDAVVLAEGLPRVTDAFAAELFPPPPFEAACFPSVRPLCDRERFPAVRNEKLARRKRPRST